MSVFTSKVTKTVAVPHDEGASVLIRKLAPRHLEMASKEQQRQSIEDLRAMGGAKFVAELKHIEGEDAVGDAKVANISRKKANPLLLFDRGVLILKGVVSWSYEEKVCEATVEDLDDKTQELLAREILQLSRPDLFETVEEAEEARKND